MENDEAAQLAFWDWQHPLLSAKSFIEAYRESDRINTARIMEKRRQISEDMERKAHYRYVVEGKLGGPGEGFGSWGIRRTQKDRDFGWGIEIDGKSIDQYIEEKEREKKEKKRLEEADQADPVISLKDEELKSTEKEQKKTWW